MAASRTAAGARVATVVGLSVALHGVAFVSLANAGRVPAPRERVEVEIIHRERRPAGAEPPALPPPAPPRARAAAQRVAIAKPVPPPPALASAPPATPQEPKALPRVGLSLGSTVSSGAFAVGIGNTLHGKAEETAADPATVRLTGGAAPAARLSAQPRPLDIPRIEYPTDARRAGVEGRVLLVLGIDERGQVTSVRVTEAPSPSLAAAALAGARRFRFAPALFEGAPGAAEIRFTYTFVLE